MPVSSPFRELNNFGIVFSMKVSGREVADKILQNLGNEIQKNKLEPCLAIILANNDPASRMYDNNKIKTAGRIGIKAQLYEFSRDQRDSCLRKLKELDEDKAVHGIIIQYPVYPDWDYDELLQKVDPKKDVDGFLPDSPFSGATALGIWEMLNAFARIEGFKKTEDFLRDKKIVVLGAGRAAGAPTVRLLKEKGFSPQVVVKETTNPDPIIKSGDIIISATGAKNVINKNNLKRGAYVIGVGVGKEKVDGEEKVFGDIKEDEVAEAAKLYCPTIGGIGPLTIVSLLKNVVESAKKGKGII